LPGNRCVLQQQHVDCKIADALLKKGTKRLADGWDTSSKAWAHMVLHLPHTKGGLGVTFNDVTKDAAFYTTTSRFVTCCNCKEACVPSQSQTSLGASGGLSSQDGVSQQQQDAPLYIPQLNRLNEASLVRGEDASNVAVTAIPAQNRVTLQILSM
jgi:hypothetical protein